MPNQPKPQNLLFNLPLLLTGTPLENKLEELYSIVQFVDEHTPLVERVGATFFEATTVLAFAHFARAGADVAVIETGSTATSRSARRASSGATLNALELG